ncbi:Hexokinase-1 [Wickerhamomyces ciferrii]|uniref:Phosphotransferase n=1 Tax=Wickerhamomyces ciferrii (strain ATCC 14091 / BCRC 22168 / CBS 111 / JCM 3599 / NBRC 0793 / NRRL Y-1031 F-60-10) TaxID=1206466 RepID=K0KZA1_WICCF|nr:Hexokinase-1 [Wickerhamomyces ciferrii]CCH46458.1 Hexokinase-1 [Wickerhamomyces ciferrii]
MTQVTLQSEVEKLVKEFTIDESTLKVLTEYFIESIEAGLGHSSDEHSKSLPMIPTFVTKVPNGREHGTYLAADLGGTNFRVCSVDLRGDSTFQLEQSKAKIPEDLLDAETSSELFSYLAKKVKQFVERHHADRLSTDEDKHLKLGFTFSYPVNQTALGKGTLIRWTKGFKIQDTVGKDVVELLQIELDKQQVPVKVVALANDTVGTLLSHAYASGASPSGKQGDSVIGAIFGTGTNGCYLEPIDEIKKLDPKIAEELKNKGETHMVVNTEWGSFDNDLKHLPNSIYDERIDKISSNPGYHMFEKRVSGMFMGEILRQVLVELHSKGVIFTQYPNYERLPHRLRTAFELDSEVLSHIEIDDSTNLKETELSLLQSLRLPTIKEERIAIQSIVRAISRRSAYLAAVPLAAILIRTKALEGYHKEVEIGVDGSVVEYYPGFRSMIRHALALSPLGPDGERKVHIQISKDGSGVGAALSVQSST